MSGLIVQGQAGKQQISRGAEGPLRIGFSGESLQTPYLPPYGQAGLDGDCYNAATQAAQVVSVALATTYTGFLLYNPLNSGYILIPKFVKVALAAAPAAIAPIGFIAALQTADPTGTTALAIQSSQVGNSKSGVGKVFSAATIATPVWKQFLLDGFTAATLPPPSVPIDLRGNVQILPGGVLGIGAVTAISAFLSISWMEVPLGS